MKTLYVGGEHGSKIGNDAIVDDDVYEELLQYNWYASRMGIRDAWYPAMCIKRKKFYLHKYICKITDPTLECDHINGNTFDARKENLKAVTRSQNQLNRKKSRGQFKYKGLSYSTSGYLRASIKINGKEIELGIFYTEEDAAHAYDAAVLKYYPNIKENLNFPDTDYSKFEIPKQVINSNSGYKNITYSQKEDKYEVSKYINGKRYRKIFKELELAIQYAKFLQDLKNNQTKEQRET